jgi:putative tricarboxylic transport membrane protein
MDWIINGFAQIFTPLNLLISFIGCFLGNLVGVLPGLGPTASIALLFPFMLRLPPLSILICLGAIYYGAMYGGSITAILLNIPGEVAAVPTAMDGYPLAQQGRAGSTMMICALSSFFGCMVALACLAFFAPLLGQFALSFGPFEYFGLIFFSLCCACGLCGSSIRKGIACALIGILVSMVGVDSATVAYRFTFGSFLLLQGIDVIPIVVGLFGITEVLQGIWENAETIIGKEGKFQSIYPNKRELLLSAGAAVRGAAIGTSLGILPGLTPSACTFIAYSLNKKLCVEKDKIGKGAIEGCACAEAANNSSAMAGFIPLLALGIPTGPVLAIVLAALIIQGVIPGPLMFSVHLNLTGAVIAGFFLGNIIMLIMNIPLVRFWVKIANLPYKWLAPVILSLCMLGTIIIRYSVFDVWVMLIAGAFGFIARKKEIPVPPLVLGLILGRSFENYFRQVAVMGFSKILVHPFSIIALLLGIGMIILFGVFKEKKPA